MLSTQPFPVRGNYIKYAVSTLFLSFYLGHLPVLMKVTKEGGLVPEVFLRW